MLLKIILLKLIPAFITALMISLVAMPAIIQIASLKKLTDEPDGERKRHEGIIPTLGGVGIFTAFIIAFSIWGNANSLQSYPYFVASLFMLFLIGIKDDILVISPLKKLGIQILASVEMVVGGGIVLNDLGGIFGLHQIPWWAGAILTVFLFVVLINSFNLIDGIDGLAGGTGIVISSVLGVWFFISGFYTMAILAAVLVGALIGFMIYNFHPARIFMGDTGAMAVGFILIYMVMQFLLLNQSNPASYFYVKGATAIALALLIIPVVDTLRVFTMRVWKGKSPFAADYNHLHHQFIKDGMGPALTSCYLWISNLWVVLLAFYFNFLNETFLVLLILAAGFAIIPFGRLAWYLIQRYTHQGTSGLFPASSKGKA